tara:strand:+ start:167 stop:1222 length:1056 start_codon:yes stop_codon:yes gene_type:complete
MQISISLDDYCKAYNLQIGVYSPLTYFVGSSDLISIAKELKLENGSFYPLPIYMPLRDQEFLGYVFGEKVDLIYENNLVGCLEVSEVYEPDKKNICINIFGTTDINHPGVKYFLDEPRLFISGIPTIFIPPSFTNEKYFMSPDQVKAEKLKRGFQSLAGFQTRNIPHRAHEHLQRTSLEICDGILIHPLVGWKKPGDFSKDSIVRAYKILIENFYPKENVIFSLFYSPMFYAGPREALFHALVRMNFGCTHFIVGRDHAGVGDFYKLYEAHQVASKFSDSLDIEFLLLRGPYYCKQCGCVVTDKHCAHSNTDSVSKISGTAVRESIINEHVMPDWLIRPQIARVLSKQDLM